VRLPKQFVEQRDIVDGSAIEIDDLKTVRAKPRRRSPYKLKDMLKNYTRPPKDLDFAPVGREMA
jgi:antitoxin component of MazEF toxin-antitoxin module